MRAGILLVLLLCACCIGCVSTSKSANADVEPSTVRQLLRQRLVALIEKQLQHDEWTGSIVDRSLNGNNSGNSETRWQQENWQVDVRTCNTTRQAIAMPTDDYKPILESLRRRIRDIVEDELGEQLDWSIVEAYRERTLIFHYRQGERLGTLSLSMKRRTDDPDDLLTRFHVVILEQPAP